MHSEGKTKASLGNYLNRTV